MTQDTSSYPEQIEEKAFPKAVGAQRWCTTVVVCHFLLPSSAKTLLCNSQMHKCMEHGKGRYGKPVTRDWAADIHAPKNTEQQLALLLRQFTIDVSRSHVQ